MAIHQSQAAPLDEVERAAPARWTRVFMAAVLLYAAVSCVDRAAHRAFWFDEIMGITVSSQPSIAAVRDALALGFDLSPPLFHGIEHLAGRLPIDRHVAYRLPSIVAFCLTLPALFLFVRRGTNDGAAAAAVAAFMASQMFTLFAVEARPYSMMVCALAWGLVLWQRADRRRYAVAACAAFLSVATSLHYYAVVALLPLAAAELTRQMRARRVRLSRWAALAVPLLPPALLAPVVAGAATDYAAHYWAHPPIAGFLRVYELIPGVTGWWGAAAAFALIGLLAMTIARTLSPRGSSVTGIPLEDQVLAIGLLLLPPVEYVAAHVTGLGMTARYLMPATLGMAAGAAFVGAVGRRGAVVMIAACCSVVLLRDAEGWYYRQPRADQSSRDAANALGRMVEAVDRPGLPVAVASGQAYLPLVFYGPPPGVSLVYLSSRALALRYVGNDTAELSLQGVAPLLHLDVQDLEAFLAGHDRFLVYAGVDWYDWLPNALADRGFRLQLLTRSADHRQELLLVERPEPHAAAK
jgi:hypothetical protein